MKENISWKSVELLELKNNINEDYLNFLYDCHSDYDARQLFTVDMCLKGKNEFFYDFRKKLKYKYQEFMIIKNINVGIPIGFIYSYRYSPNDGTLYTTIYLNDISRNTVYGVEAGILFYEYLFNKYSIRKIYCSVYSYNKSCISFLKNAGFKPEGNLRKSKYYKGKYFDTYIFALYKADFQCIRNKLKKEEVS